MIFDYVKNIDGQILLVFLLILLIPGFIFLSIFIPLRIVHNKYTKYVNNHSVALKKLNQINSRYSFYPVENIHLHHKYDNDIYYRNISCQDYLIYELMYSSKKIAKCCQNADANEEIYKKYNAEVINNVVLGTFDGDNMPKNRKKLERMESDIVKHNLATPCTNFIISVQLVLTNINGQYRTSKFDKFSENEIRKLITKVNNRRNGFFKDDEIWNAIVRVERGKVTNKMRFAIYKRDHYRCRMCGRKTNDLEIDHIIPIAKGGKTTYNNLQTLCHRCNVKKGADIIY